MGRRFRRRGRRGIGTVAKLEEGKLGDFTQIMMYLDVFVGCRQWPDMLGWCILGDIDESRMRS
eukprot:1352555-Amorphochlora_amoeboformis.AAC.1